MSWLDKLKQYAPDIAMAVASGGATLPQLALKAVSDAVGASVSNTSDLSSLITNASPETLLKIKEANSNFIIKKLELELKDLQVEHETTQKTIRNGDNAVDKEVRLTRPTMAKQSWTATIGYCIGCFGVQAIAGQDFFNIYIASILSSPAWAYLGLRTGDKFAEATKFWGKK